MDALAASPFALLDARGSLRLDTDAVHEDDALCLALACRPLRDALAARFPACPRAGGRAVARLAARVTADGELDLRYDPDDPDEVEDGGLRGLPEGFGRLVYLPGPGLRKLDLSNNAGLVVAFPEGLLSLVGLEVLNLGACGLRALPEGIGRLAGLKVLHLSNNRELTALPEGLCALVGLVALSLVNCGLRALPEGIGALAGLWILSIYGNRGLAALPAGLCELAGLEELDVEECGLTALPEGIGGLAGLKKLNLSYNTELTALPEALCSLAELDDLNLAGGGLAALPEGMEGLTRLRTLDLLDTAGLTALPAGLGRLHSLEHLDLGGCPGLADLYHLQRREGLPALLAHLAGQGPVAPAGDASSCV
jgi:Leucine-rich repeat (LRR) protein